MEANAPETIDAADVPHSARVGRGGHYEYAILSSDGVDGGVVVTYRHVYRRPRGSDEPFGRVETRRMGGESCARRRPKK